jgi:predicted nucleic acid-binding protein
MSGWKRFWIKSGRNRRVPFFSTQKVCLALTDFSLFSIGIILTRLKKDPLFQTFLQDTVEESGVVLIRLDTEGLNEILTLRKSVSLDFDDAYQYVAAQKHNLQLVSFDTDFDRTERGRKTPQAALQR